MNSMKLFWGMILLLTGATFIAVNMGYVESSVWLDIFALWPLILVVLGLRLLIKNEKLLAVIYMLIVLFAVSFIVASAGTKNITSSRSDDLFGGMMNRVTYSENLTDTFDISSSKNQNIRINTGAAKVHILALSGDKPSDTLYVVKTRDMGKLSIQKTVSGDSINLVIEESSAGLRLGHGMINREIEVYLSPALLSDIGLDSGASKLNIDFSQLQIVKADLNIGASSGDIYLGSKTAKQGLTVDSGASKIVFHMPPAIGVRATFDNGVSSINTEFAPEMTKTGNIYVTKNFENAPTQISITGSVGASSVKFQTE